MLSPPLPSGGLAILVQSARWSLRVEEADGELAADEVPPSLKVSSLTRCLALDFVDAPLALICNAGMAAS